MLGTMVQCSLSEEVDMPSVISAESLEQGSDTLVIITVSIALTLISLLAVLFYRRSAEEDTYADEELWSDHTGHVMENMAVAKLAPSIPEPGGQEVESPHASTLSAQTEAEQVTQTQQDVLLGTQTAPLPISDYSTLQLDSATASEPASEAAELSIDESVAEPVIEETEDLADIQDAEPTGEALDWGAEW